MRRLTSWLRRTGRGTSSAPFPGTIEIAGRKVSEIRLLGGYHRPGITKAGRLSVRGLCAGQPVKIYSAHSAEQIRLRRALQEVALASGLNFPEIVASDEHLVAERWLEGVSLTSLRGPALAEAAERIRQFLHECHADARLLEVARNFDGSFCYLENYLLPRLGGWSNIHEIAGFVRQWQAEYASAKPVLSRRISHPDLSLANLLVEKGSGQLFVVDNELLGVGAGWVLDWHNSLLRELQRPPLDAVGSEFESFVRMCWRLRRLGSALDAGDFSRAFQEVAG